MKAGREDDGSALRGDRRHFEDRSDGDGGGKVAGASCKPVATKSVAVAFDDRDETGDRCGQRVNLAVPRIGVDGENESHGQDATQ